jgi:hypothetical protein
VSLSADKNIIKLVYIPLRTNSLAQFGLLFLSNEISPVSAIRKKKGKEMARSDRFHAWKHLQIFPRFKWLNLKGKVKVVLTNSPSARILVAAVQPCDASVAHAGLKKVVMNIVLRVSPLSTKLDCNSCH